MRRYPQTSVSSLNCRGSEILYRDHRFCPPSTHCWVRIASTLLTGTRHLLLLIGQGIFIVGVVLPLEHRGIARHQVRDMQVPVIAGESPHEIRAILDSLRIRPVVTVHPFRGSHERLQHPVDLTFGLLDNVTTEVW